MNRTEVLEELLNDISSLSPDPEAYSSFPPIKYLGEGKAVRLTELVFDGVTFHLNGGIAESRLFCRSNGDDLDDLPKGLSLSEVETFGLYNGDPDEALFLNFIWSRAREVLEQQRGIRSFAV